MARIHKKPQNVACLHYAHPLLLFIVLTRAYGNGGSQNIASEIRVLLTVTAAVAGDRTSFGYCVGS